MVEVVLLHHTPELQNIPCPHGKTLVRIKYLCLYIITRSIPPLLSISHSIVTPIHEVYTGCLHWCFCHYTVDSSMPHHNLLSLTWESHHASLSSLLATHKTISYGLW